MTRKIETMRVRMRMHPEVDWIYLRFDAGCAHFTVRTSSVHDPFPSLLRWLEAICIGVAEAAFTVDEEGPGVRLVCEQYPRGADALVRMSRDRDETRVFSARVDKAQLMSAVYTAFRRFVESERYDRYRWQEMNVGKWCEAELGYRYTAEVIGEHLAALEPQEAEAKLGELWPVCSVQAAGIPDGPDLFRATLDALAAEKQGDLSAPPLERTPAVAGLAARLAPLDYAGRCEVIHEFLERSTANFVWGEALDRLRSPVVERFLADRFGVRTRREGNVIRFPIIPGRAMDIAMEVAYPHWRYPRPIPGPFQEASHGNA